jgi:amidase
MIRTVVASVLVSIVAISPAVARGAQQTDGPAGRWVVKADFFGTVRYLQLQLERSGERLTGRWSGDALEGTLRGNRVQFVAKDARGGTTEVEATMNGGSMTGTIVDASPGDPAPVKFTFTATLVRPLPPPTHRRHEFTPTVFYRQFSPATEPVLRIGPGDTVHTTTVDAGGADEHGVRRSAGGNPQTGPFYIEGAMPGDTLVVHLTHLRLNRSWAGSDDAIVESGLNSRLAVKVKDNDKSVRWKLDVEKGVATPATPDEHLGRFAVPLRPMLGCIATAPGPAAAAPPPTGDSGPWGGNLDFNELAEGSTVYLPVNNPGALLYLGDGHALQGDGELNGNALETSMDVEFAVDVIQGKRVPSVRAETPDAIIAMGYEGSLDDAFRSATANMAQWLADDYALTPSEVAQVLGTTAQYAVSEVADRNSGIVLKISKARLRTLTPR